MGTVLTAIVGATQDQFGQWSGGTTYNLSDGSLSWIVSDDGLGMSPSHRILERGPLQDGVSDLGFRLDQRLISLVLGTQATNLAGLYNNRESLLEIFNPYFGGQTSTSSNPMQLRWVLDNGKTYQIDCFYAGQMSLPSSDRKGFQQNVAVQFICPDPTFYNPTILHYTGAAASGSGGFGINVSPLLGSAPTRFVLKLTSTSITATGSNFYIAHQEPPLGYIGESGITLNTTITNGLVVDTRYGHLTVVDGSGTNLMPYVSYYPSTSSLVDFKFINGLSTSFLGVFTGSCTYDLYFYSRYVGF